MKKLLAFSLAATAAISAYGEKSRVFVLPEEGPKLYAGMNTLYGPTGLFSVPTSSTVRLRNATLGASFADGLRGPSLNYGLIDWVEVGGAFMDRDGADDKAIANGKVTFLPSNFKQVSLGIGVIDALDAFKRTVYVVGSADLVTPDIELGGHNAVGFRVHGGYGSGLFREKLIGGAELYFKEGFSLIGEYDGANVNGGARYTRDNVQLQAGVLNKKFFFGVSAGMKF